MPITSTRVNNIEVFEIPQSVYNEWYLNNTLDDNSFYLIKDEIGFSSVEFTQTNTSGTEIAKIIIDGEENSILVPNDISGNATTATTATNSNNLKITSNTSSTNKLPILFAGATPTSGGNSAINYNTNVTVQPSTGVLFGAAWNDYAEYRKLDEKVVRSGRVVCETGKDSVKYSTERLQFAPAIISDTYGFVIGENKEGFVPLAVGGKVLAYPHEDVEKFKVGTVVCSGPDGTVSKMTRQEIIDYPDRILGFYVGTPEEEEFNGVKIDGRIWIRLR